jgi:hypothetical protein
VFDPVDLFEDDVSITDSTVADSDGSTEGLFDISWDHIPGYLSETSVSDANMWSDMPSL